MHVIPCSFSTQYKDPTDPTGRFVQKDIKIGSDETEADGSLGQSATQKTTVHAIRIGGTMIRLIDTPGIGDVRGAEQDKRNMADILSVLRGYERLHCVLMLLKPNNARLNIMFRFCIKELLTHLHRSAAHNMVFGFTNTRGSNYTPGDTFKPLEHLLNEHNDSDLGLFERNVYCFDSESFRYLAANKKGVHVGAELDYSRSWVQSEKESHRLLEHIKTLTPHEIKRMMSLNETRALITQLTTPMAEIAQQIKASIAISEDEIKELDTKKMTRVELEGKLHVQKKILKAHQLDRPRTVCTHRDCIDFQNDGLEGILKTIYKTKCHNPCYLENVPVETVGTPELIKCWAFNGQEHCRGCNHHWQEHLHVFFELKEETTTVKDETIDENLRKNTNSMALRQAAIKKRAIAIKEFEQEHKAIQLATAKFSLYLKKNSITPYNDATIEYLDHLIKKELEKVQAGGPLKKLTELEAYKRQYAQIVEVFNTNLQAGIGERVLDTAGVEAEVRKLYSLKHYGKNLQRLRQVVETAHAATFREKPYQVKQKKWTPLNFITGYWDDEPKVKPAPAVSMRQAVSPPRVETRTHHIPQMATWDRSRLRTQQAERAASPLIPRRPQPVSSPWLTSAELEGSSNQPHTRASGIQMNQPPAADVCVSRHRSTTSSSIAESFLLSPTNGFDHSSSQPSRSSRFNQGFNRTGDDLHYDSRHDNEGCPQSPYTWLDPSFAESPAWNSPHPPPGMRHRANTNLVSVPENEDPTNRQFLHSVESNDPFASQDHRRRHTSANTNTLGSATMLWDDTPTSSSVLNRTHSVASTSAPPPPYFMLSRTNTSRLSLHDRFANEDGSRLPGDGGESRPELAGGRKISLRRLVPTGGFWTRRR